ncbi:MAG: hypothetical protein NT062_38645 [Proteobacteria bacterium]|nr:hypothetical protein [Pseudomonadota bacterium]
MRVAREVHPGYGWTASAGASLSNHDAFGRVTGGGLLVQRWPDDLGPGVLAPTQMMMSAEAVVAVGGNHGLTDAHARAGFQIGLGFLHVLVWR